MRGRGGFTAPELIAVLLVISLAIGVLAYIGSVARGAAQGAACESNLQQIALAMRMYASDNDGHMPPSPTGSDALMPYMKNTGILKCPRDPAVAPKKWYWDENPEERSAEEPRDIQSSYIMNPHVEADDPPSSIIAGEDKPGRHLGRRWIGVRLDGATFFWPKDQWEEKIGWVMRYEKPSNH